MTPLLTPIRVLRVQWGLSSSVCRAHGARPPRPVPSGLGISRAPPALARPFSAGRKAETTWRLGRCLGGPAPRWPGPARSPEVPGDAAGPPSLCQSLHTWSPSQGVRRQSGAGRLGWRLAASGAGRGAARCAPTLAALRALSPLLWSIQNKYSVRGAPRRLLRLVAVP